MVSGWGGGGGGGGPGPGPGPGPGAGGVVDPGKSSWGNYPGKSKVCMCVCEYCPDVIYHGYAVCRKKCPSQTT